MNIFRLIYRLFTCQSYKEHKVRKEEKERELLKETWEKWLDENV